MNAKRSALLMVCAVTVYSFSQRMSVVPFYDLFIREYGISYAQAGGLLSAFFVGYALFMLPAGVLADRLESRNVLVAGLAVMGVSSTVFAMVNDYTLSMAMRFLVGIGMALIHPPAVRILAANFDRRMLGVAIGLREAALGMGFLTATSLFPFLAKRYDPFRILLILGLLWIPIAAGFLLARPSGRSIDAGGRTPRGLDVSVLVRKNVLLLAGASFFGLFSVNGFIGWFPAYLEKALGMEKTAAGVIVGANTIAMIALSLFSGRISDRIGRRNTMAAGSGVLSVVLVLLLSGSVVPAATLSSLAGASTGLGMPALVAMGADIAGVKNAGTVTGLVTAVGQFASAIAGSFLGWLVDVSGAFSLMWASMLASLAVQALFLFSLRERSDSSEARIG